MEIELYLTRLEDRRVLSVAPGVLDAQLVLPDANAVGESVTESAPAAAPIEWDIPSGGGLSTIVYSKAPNSSEWVQLFHNGNLTYSALISEIGPLGLRVNGTESPDVLIIYFGAGNPIPSGGMHFDGGLGDGDLLILHGGDFEKINNTFLSDSAGTILLTDAQATSAIGYTGLEPVLINVGTVADMVFDFGQTGPNDDVAILEDAVIPGHSQLLSQNGTFEDTTFVNPSNSLTINLGAGSDSLGITSLSSFTASLTVHGQTGTDQINVVEDLTLGSDSDGNSLHLVAEELVLGADVTTTGEQVYDGAVTLKQDVTLSGVGIDFQGTVDGDSTGPFRLAVDTPGGDLHFRGSVGSDGQLSEVAILQADNVTVHDTLRAGSFKQSDGSGTTSIEGAVDVDGPGGVALTTHQIVVRDRITTTTGNVDLIASGSLWMQDGAVVHAVIGEINFEAGGDIRVGRLVAASLVTLHTSGGAVLDGGDLGGADIVSPSISLRAARGIGQSDALETAAGTIAAGNTTSGDIQINNTANGLVVGTVGNLVGIVNEGGGDIRLSSSGDIQLENRVTTSGGERIGDDASRSVIVIEAVGNITIADGVIVATATGSMSHDPPPMDVELAPVDQGGSDVSSLGYAIIDVTINDAGTNYQIRVDWSDGTIVIYPPASSVSGEDTFDAGQTYRFDHFYTGNPDIENPSSPIPVFVTVLYDGRFDTSNGEAINGITFREAGVVLSTTVEDELTVPGEGLFAAIKVVKSEIVPVELRSQQQSMILSGQMPTGSGQSESYRVMPTNPDTAEAGDVRLFFRRVDAAGIEDADVELPAKLLESGLNEVFKSFPNGHYRVYLQGANSQQVRVLRDIHVYQGNVVPADFREEISEMQLGGNDSPQNRAEGDSAEETGQETSERETPGQNQEQSVPDDGQDDPGQVPAGSMPLDASQTKVDARNSANTQDVILGSAAIGLALGNRWASQIDRAYQSERRSLSKAARLYRKLRRGQQATGN